MTENKVENSENKSVSDVSRPFPIVAIDGPAGSGKSVVARTAAEKLGFVYVDTGALYRAVAWEVLRHSHDLKDEQKISELARDAHIEFRFVDGENRIFFNAKDISQEIRTNEVSMAASRVSTLPGVRAALLGLQRKLGKTGKTILEGRDIGTVIFPDAEIKVFLTANAEVRARRRHEQLLEMGNKTSSELEILEEIKKRDERDSTRNIAPLKKADDAIEVDTSEMSLEQVISRVVQIVKDWMRENAK